MAERKAHVADYKKKVVENLKKLMAEYPIIGALNLEGMPTPQLQKMRAKLREKATITMTKRRLMNLAFDDAEQSKKGVVALKEKLIGMPALLFTKENPFTLFNNLKKSKTPAPAKAGQTAPKDIVVTAGPTQFAPGPIISELGSFGLKTKVENGKIAIQEDKIVAKEGDIIDAKLAGLLTKLSIEPMEIGLDLVAVYEDGIIYDKKVLNVDEDQFIADMQTAALWAFNLAVESGYPAKEVFEFLIPKAFRESKALALEANIMCDAIAEEIVQKAERQAASLNSQLDIKIEAPQIEKTSEKNKMEEEKKEETTEAPQEEKQEETTEAPQEEEKKEETTEAPAEEEKKEESTEAPAEEKSE